MCQEVKQSANSMPLNDRKLTTERLDRESAQFVPADSPGVICARARERESRRLLHCRSTVLLLYRPLPLPPAEQFAKLLKILIANCLGAQVDGTFSDDR